MNVLLPTVTRTANCRLVTRLSALRFAADSLNDSRTRPLAGAVNALAGSVSLRFLALTLIDRVLVTLMFPLRPGVATKV